MATNSKQFGINRSDPTPRRGNKVNVSSLEQELIELTSLMRQMAVRNGQNVKVCGIFTARRHATDMCPMLQEKTSEQVNAAGGFPEAPQRNYDPYLNTFNPGWKDHPNLRYGNPLMNQSAPQMGQLATAINRLEAQNSSSLPSHTVVNPKKNVSAITLRSGRELKVHEEVVQTLVKKEEVEESKLKEDEIIQETPKGKFPPLSEYKPVAPFPLALKESRKDEGDVHLDTTMLDLGASINVMSYSVYVSLKLRPLNETATVIQMADRSTIYPRGVIEDVLVKVGNLASQTEPKLPPDRAKEITMGKGINHQETGIPKKSKKRKHGQKITAKLFKWVKVDKGTRYKPP
ncbi:uncharacterized protein [Henckelia pumila]|uniref:uncharacterized protein n=1 Tax=Henckelia pumila TaxID=405737 RepID=UPI003C6DD26C